MTARHLLDDLRRRGITIAVSRSGRLRVRAWNRLTPDEQAAVQLHKESLIELLTATPRVDYEAYGFTLINGVMTHPLGDDVAEQIRTGAISHDEALAMARASKQQSQSLADARTVRRVSE